MEECEQECAKGAILELTTLHVVIRQMNLTARHVYSVFSGTVDDNDIMDQFEWPSDLEHMRGRRLVPGSHAARRLEARRTGIRRLAGVLDSLASIASNTKLELELGIIKRWEKLWGSESTVGAFAQVSCGVGRAVRRGWRGKWRTPPPPTRSLQHAPLLAAGSWSQLVLKDTLGIKLGYVPERALWSDGSALG